MHSVQHTIAQALVTKHTSRQHLRWSPPAPRLYTIGRTKIQYKTMIQARATWSDDHTRTQLNNIGTKRSSHGRGYTRKEIQRWSHTKKEHRLNSWLTRIQSAIQNTRPTAQNGIISLFNVIRASTATCKWEKAASITAMIVCILISNSSFGLRHQEK